MKQQLSHKQIELMCSQDQDYLATELGCNKTELINCITIGGMIELIRKHHQMDIYTVDFSWCIHLFEPYVAANDIDISCIYETYTNELIDTLFTSLLWVYENMRNTSN